MAGVKQCVKLGQATLRNFSTNRALCSTNPEQYSLYKKLKANQELYQREDTVEEVHLKGGIKDAIAFKLIVGLTIAGLIYDGKVAYDLATNT